MADLTDFFNSGGSGGVSNVKTNPLELPVNVIKDVKTNNSSYSYTSTFWNEFVGCGGYRKDIYNTNRTTLVDVTNGSGYLYNVISQSCQEMGTNVNAYIYVTVDGIEYTVSGVLNKQNIGNYDRLVLGAVITPLENTWTTNMYNTSQEVPIIRNGLLQQAGDLEMLQAPILRFETSLKVETKIDVNYTGSYAYATGVNYRLEI